MHEHDKNTLINCPECGEEICNNCEADEFAHLEWCPSLEADVDLLDGDVI